MVREGVRYDILLLGPYNSITPHNTGDNTTPNKGTNKGTIPATERTNVIAYDKYPFEHLITPIAPKQAT